MGQWILKVGSYYLIAFLIILSIGFCWGVEHQANKEWKLERQYTPMYTSRIVVNHGTDKILAYTVPKCDSFLSKSDGYWLNQYITDTSAFIVVELCEWPFMDECK